MATPGKPPSIPPELATKAKQMVSQIPIAEAKKFIADISAKSTPEMKQAFDKSKAEAQTQATKLFQEASQRTQAASTEGQRVYKEQMSRLVGLPEKKIHEYLYLSSFLTVSTVPILAWQVWSHSRTKSRLQTTQSQLATTQESLIEALRDQDDLKAKVTQMELDFQSNMSRTAPHSAPETSNGSAATTTTTATTPTSTTATPPPAPPATSTRPVPRHPAIQPHIHHIHERIYLGTNGFRYFFDESANCFFIEGTDGFYYPEDEMLEIERRREEQRLERSQRLRDQLAEARAVREREIQEKAEMEAELKLLQAPQSQAEAKSDAKSTTNDGDDAGSGPPQERRQPASSRRASSATTTTAAPATTTTATTKTATSDATAETPPQQEPSQPKPKPARPQSSSVQARPRIQSQSQSELPVEAVSSDGTVITTPLTARIDPVSGLPLWKVRQLQQHRETIYDYMDSITEHTDDLLSAKNQLHLQQNSSLNALLNNFQELFEFYKAKARVTPNGKIDLSDVDIQILFRPVPEFLQIVEGNIEQFAKSHRATIDMPLKRSERPLPAYHRLFHRYNREVNDEMNAYLTMYRDFVTELGNKLIHFRDFTNSDQSVDALQDQVLASLADLRRNMTVLHQQQVQTQNVLNKDVLGITMDQEAQLDSIPSLKVIQMARDRAQQQPAGLTDEQRQEQEWEVAAAKASQAQAEWKAAQNKAAPSSVAQPVVPSPDPSVPTPVSDSNHI